MKRIQFISNLMVVGFGAACSRSVAQPKHVGGPCEGCEAVFEYGHATLSPTATLPDFGDPGAKMEMSGTIYENDGKTPAAGVILYIYHTDQTGVYPANGNEPGWGKRHGFIRAWIKTNATGKYTFLTLKPAPYPGRDAPAHVHATIKEPGITAYWIDEYLFDDDPLLTPRERAAQRKRGGNGILTLRKNANGILVAHRDIVLGLNIPNY